MSVFGIAQSTIGMFRTYNLIFIVVRLAIASLRVRIPNLQSKKVYSNLLFAIRYIGKDFGEK